MEIGQNFTKWCKTLNSKAKFKIFGEFWECTSGISYFIRRKRPFLNAQSWSLLAEITNENIISLSYVQQNISLLQIGILSFSYKILPSEKNSKQLYFL